MKFLVEDEICEGFHLCSRRRHGEDRHECGRNLELTHLKLKGYAAFSGLTLLLSDTAVQPISAPLCAAQWAYCSI